MKVIVGLGNPGIEYVHTRHNVGWLFLDYLVDQEKLPAWQINKKFSAQIIKTQINNQEVLLVRPQTFMNLSGESVAKIINFYKLDPQKDLIVVYDDLDLKLGEAKITSGHGPHSHNGLFSIYNSLAGEKDFTQVRIGTDERHGERKIAPANYVLLVLTEAQRKILGGVFGQIWQKLRPAI